MTEFEDLGVQLERAFLSLDWVTARKILMESGHAFAPIQIADGLITPVLERIGTEWERGTVSLSQVYMSGRICEELVGSILPPSDPNRKSRPKMAVAALQDFHLLGKRIVYSALCAGGFQLLDYGRVTVEDLVNHVKKDSIEILLISTLMLSSALRIKELRANLNGSNPNLKIVVGGAPFRFDDHLWKEVDADAMGKNASEALEIVTRIAGGMR